MHLETRGLRMGCMNPGTGREAERVDVVIVGAGVTGASLAYLLSRYTDVGSVAVIEKGKGVAEVSSHASHNSQTLHFGDIETNYTVEKAVKVKAAAEMVVRYAEGLSGMQDVVRPMQKMVLGVGAGEISVLRARYEEFRSTFPETRFIGRETLADIEPAVVEGRDQDEPVAAIYNPRGYAVDFGALAASFVEQAARFKPGGLELLFGRRVRSIRPEEDRYLVEIEGRVFSAGAVVVAAGAYSLRMAHDLGYGLDYTLLPVAGDFFVAPNVLRGKVYTVQEKLLPFAAVHADPDLEDAGRMRLGPVAVATPLLEPKRWRSLFDFFRVFRPDAGTLSTVIKVNAEPIVRRFILRHLTYYLPFIGRRLFARDARKIIPSLRAEDVRFAKELGGVRPQVADKKKHSLLLGEAKISDGGLIFNITPSPGASVCLKNALDDSRALMTHFAGRFRLDEEALERDLGERSGRA